MSVLCPRLLPSEADRLFAELHEHPVGEHGKMVKNHSSKSVFAATGGHRVTPNELDEMRDAIVKAAHEQGFPDRLESVNDFDRQTARILHEQSRMVPGEAAQRQVWAFLALVLLPDVCVWRWPANAKGEYYAERFKGMDLTRHALGRLWTCAHILHEPQAPEPYGLLAVLGENDLDQVMARRKSLAASPALVRAVVRGHRNDRNTTEGVSSRKVLRESLMRLLRLTAFLNVDSLSEPVLDHLVRMLRLEARAALERPLSD